MPILDEQDKLNQALNGKVAADQITPYPPGIPVLVPGQVITQDILKYLAGLLRSLNGWSCTESCTTDTCHACVCLPRATNCCQAPQGLGSTCLTALHWAG